jgi:hypothetical protein
MVAVSPRQQQRDPKPESLDYRDDGCEVHPHCLSCPLPQCIFDTGGRSYADAKRDRRVEAVAALRAQGLVTMDIVAELRREHGIGRRTALYWIALAQREGDS